MARTPLYSPSARGPHRPASAPAAPTDPQPAAAPTRRRRLVTALRRRERWLWAGAVALAAVVAGWPGWTRHVQPPPTIDQIDAAIRESIAKDPLDSAAAAAYAAVVPSIVRVIGERDAPPDAGPAAGRPGKPASRATPAEHEAHSVGTGVVIVDKGLILTNLHVVSGAKRIKLTFMLDGSESEAIVVGTQPENDLAVLQATTIPDDLQPATLRSTADLSPGDEVIAVGFPFGIGPSVSKGVVSGLQREFVSPEGRQTLTNLIQFDAAANPGNSGGPLVTMDGHVVGIVTAIMNPNGQRTFIGIGFAVPIENAAAAAGMPPF